MLRNIIKHYDKCYLLVTDADYLYNLSYSDTNISIVLPAEMRIFRLLNVSETVLATRGFDFLRWQTGTVCRTVFAIFQHLQFKQNARLRHFYFMPHSSP